MDFARMMRQAQGGGGTSSSSGNNDSPQNDNAETVYISSLALLKVCSPLNGQIEHTFTQGLS